MKMLERKGKIKENTNKVIQSFNLFVKAAKNS